MRTDPAPSAEATLKAKQRSGASRRAGNRRQRPQASAPAQSMAPPKTPLINTLIGRGLAPKVCRLFIVPIQRRRNARNVIERFAQAGLLIEPSVGILDPRAIALVEVKTRALLLDRGYKLSGYPLKPPGPLEKFKLTWNNKVYKWKFASIAMARSLL